MDNMRVIYFGDENDEAYGNINSFKDVEDFKNEIEVQLGYKVQLSNIKAKKCVMTSKGIPCDLLIPLDITDLDINTYYIADIEKLEEDSNDIKIDLNKNTGIKIQTEIYKPMKFFTEGEIKFDIKELLDQIAKLLLEGDNANLNKICNIADKYDIDFGEQYR